MTTFAYAVRDKSGKVVKGKLDGESQAAVQSKLSQMGYIILELRQQSALMSFGAIKIGGSVKPKEVTIFARQFSTMIHAGLSLTKCLTILSQQTESAALKEVIAQIGKDVEAGQSLSEGLAKHPKVFPPIFVSMTRAGEIGGVLDEVLARVADHLEAEQALKGKIRSAMMYPIAIGCLVVLILAAMLIFVVPIFVEMFAGMGGTLPLPTQILVDFSNLVTSFWGLVILAAIIAVIWFFRWWSKGAGKLAWDRIKLGMPVFGPLVRKIALARFSRTFATLVSAGVPILQALDIVAETSGNEVISLAVKKSRAAIKEGETIAKPLSESKVFPPMLVQMISVGEETGALDTMLNKVAEFYDEEVASATDGLTSLIEPLMMVTLGLIVGGMVIALYLPMFNVIALVK
ncbi:MAG: type II secretion system F family protein [Coriobacteriia bacterium]|nr:type II secretion system F family protein [Coriobacteriia bacterium]